MKKTLTMTALLMTLSAAALAQSPDTQRRQPVLIKGDAADAKKSEADEAATRAKLEKARAELDRAAREVAELSMQLDGADRHNFVFVGGGPRRAVLGVQVENGKEGARVSKVSPGGPAAEAGLQDGDVIVALDGKSIAGGEESARVLVREMRGVKPEQKVKVKVLRAGKNRDYVVVARPFAGPGFDERAFNIAMPDVRPMVEGAMPMVRQFRTFIHNEFDGLELASITPKLGAYFGANDGVLVVQAPESDSFKLEDGDVIQAIDGRKPADGAHALRILRSYKPGEKLNLAVLRQRKPVTLAVTMPERPEPMDHFEMAVPGPSPMPMPPGPPIPAMPPPPAGSGTDY